MALLGPGTPWDIITGGMDNLLQGGVGGAIGALLGVGGAYLVATRTTKKELQRDRLLTRELASVQAAGRVTTVLYDIRRHLDNIDDDVLARHPDLALRRLVAWEALQEKLQRIVVEEGSLLPDVREKALSDLLSTLDHAYATDRDETGYPFFIQAGTEPGFAQLVDRVTAELEELRKYRRETGQER